MVHRLRRLHIRVVGPRLVHHLAQQLGVFQHRAGAQVVLVERLAVVVRHKQRAVQDLQNAAVVDVGVGVVDKDTGLRVARRVDMEVVASTGDAATHKLAVVLEVHGVERDIALLRAQVADAVDHIFALGRAGHQLRGGIVAHRHIVEIEPEVGAFLAEHPHKVVAGHGLEVGTGVADGSAKQNAILLEQVHGVHDSVIVAVAAAGVVGGGSALNGQHERNVAQTDHLFAERLINEGGVGVDGKLHIIVLLGQLEDIRLADQRLAARQHIEVDAQLLALGDDLIHICKAEVVLVAVLPGPAAHAVHVAGRGGVKQDQPGDVALVLDAVLPDGLGAPEKRLVPQVESRGAGHVGVGLVQHAVDELGPLAVRVAQHQTGMVIGLLAEAVTIELLCKIDHLNHGFLAVFMDMGKRYIDQLSRCGALHLMGQGIKCRVAHNLFPPTCSLPGGVGRLGISLCPKCSILRAGRP